MAQRSRPHSQRESSGPARVANRSAEPTASPGRTPTADGEAHEPLPYRAEMERAFGLSFGDVTARTGIGAALDLLGADAATHGTEVAFRATNPRPGQVAHELTHVLQQRRPSSERGIGAAGGAAEREAARNALRVDLGLAPKLPQERASPEAVYRDVKSDLRKAMAGWGTDEDAIYDRLGRATPDEKKLVREDVALMEELRDELNRGEWVKALYFLGEGVETQIREAGSGWGTDEEGIYRAVETADAAALKQMLGNGATLLYLRDELSDGELGRVLGSAAGTMHKDAAIPKEEVFHTLMLFPSAVEKACNRFDAVGGATALATGVIAALPLGATMPAGTIADVDVHIERDGNKDRIMASLRRRWDFGTGRQTQAPVSTPGTGDWTTDLIRKVHRALKMVPPEHVTQTTADIKFVGVDPTLKGTTTGGWWMGGGTNVIGLNEDSSGIADTVRHEVGHAMDTLLQNQAGDLSTAWKKNALNNWDWGAGLAIWENRMTDPWKQRDGTLVPAADQATIRTAIESYATTTDCKQDLRAYVRGLSPTHAMLNYWGNRVAVIEAAKSIAGIGGQVCWQKGKMALNNGSRFSWKPNRSFLVFSDFVWQNVANDYALSNHPEFFAVLYEIYYSKGSGNERKSTLKVANWQSFFDNTVHGAR
ncbi:MAG: DUF4157 domain-containing protein [Alphaproteobacteria bacterium]